MTVLAVLIGVAIWGTVGYYVFLAPAKPNTDPDEQDAMFDQMRGV